MSLTDFASVIILSYKICLLGFTSRMCEKFYDVDIEKNLKWKYCQPRKNQRTNLNLSQLK